MAEKEEKSCCKDQNKYQHVNSNAGAGTFYGLGFIGALIYYIQTAGSFWLGVLGVLKAIVWPAILVYQIFSLLKL